MKYRTIVADPPWDVKAGPAQGAARSLTGSKSLDLSYPTMTVDELKQLPVGDFAEKEAHLYIWTINAYIEAAYEVARTWGFKPTTLITWCKPAKGLGLGGAYCQTSEHILFCWRGRSNAKTRHNSTWFLHRRRRHSEKPPLFMDIVEKVSHGPYLELFARERRFGWDAWGNEVDSDIELAA